MRLTDGDSGRVAEFFRRLYKHADAGCLELRFIDPSGVRSTQSRWHALVEAPRAYTNAQSDVALTNAHGYDCFFGVNPRVRGGLDDDSVLSGVALWADVDGIGSLEEAEKELDKLLGFTPIQPDAAVYSGNGLHLYGFLKSAYDPAEEDWGLYLKALRGYAHLYGGDPKCVNPSRVLRFPLGYSHKRKCFTRLWLRDE